VHLHPITSRFAYNGQVEILTGWDDRTQVHPEISLVVLAAVSDNLVCEGTRRCNNLRIQRLANFRLERHAQTLMLFSFCSKVWSARLPRSEPRLQNLVI
jgi:hypothetical protein